MYLVFDLETESTEYKGRKGNPWINKILCYGLKYQEPISGLTLFTEVKDYMPRGWLDGVKILIGHNIKYDLLYIWRNNELQNYFRLGGRIWDTQLSEYILTGQQSKYVALRDIAVNKYNCKARTKKIEEGLKAGIMTQDMDIEDLLFDVKNDVLDTEVIALQQVKIAKETRMYNLIISEMDALLATIEMEFNGLFINKDILNKNKLDLQIEYERKKKELMNIIRMYWK